MIAGIDAYTRPQDEYSAVTSRLTIAAMKRRALEPVWRLAAFAVLAALILIPARPLLAQFSGFHLSFATQQLTGPYGDSEVHVGDTLEFQASVLNLDAFLDSITLSKVSLVIHHGRGDVTLPNLAANGVTAPSFGDVAGVSTSFVVEPEDGDNLTIQSEIEWTDNWDGALPGIRQTYSAFYGFSVRVMKPAVQVFQQSHVAPAYPLIAFGGFVTNTGNAPLYDVVVVSDNGTPEDATDDSTTVVGVLSPNKSAPYSGAYRARGSSTDNTVTVRGTDALGLTVTHSNTRNISVALKIVRSGPQAVKVSWPNWAEGYRLESNTGLGQSWTLVGRTPTPGEGEFSLTLTASTNQFYRLRGP